MGDGIVMIVNNSAVPLTPVSSKNFWSTEWYFYFYRQQENSQNHECSTTRLCIPSVTAVNNLDTRGREGGDENNSILEHFGLLLRMVSRIHHCLRR